METMIVNSTSIYYNENRMNESNGSDNLFEEEKNQLKTLQAIDITFRCFALFTHVLYFLLVFVIKELKSRSLIFIHQVNFYGMIFSLHYCLYIGSVEPNVSSNQKVNEVLCSLSECLWGTLKPLRAFSILGLAVFRLTALIRVDVFRSWIRSPYRLTAPILANLVISFSFTVTLKLGLSTTHGPFLCLDGYSTLLPRALTYFIVSSVFGIILPCTLVCLMYAYKISYLKNTGNGTLNRWFGANSRKRVTEIYGSLDNMNDDVVVANRNQRRLARQVLVMNAFLIASLLSFILTNAANMFEQFNDYRYSTRFSLRLLTIFFQALVPVASIAGHTRMLSLVRKFRFKSLLHNNRVVPTITGQTK